MKEQTGNCDTILIIEDDFDIREALKDALELEGYHVLTAKNGKEGLETLLTVASPCLVLLDMMMPVMGGREFLHELKKDATLMPIPVFIVSAIADKVNTDGAVGFIKKPADLDVVLKMVERYCCKPDNPN